MNSLMPELGTFSHGSFLGGGGGGFVTKSCMTLATPWTVACQIYLSRNFPRHKYWSGLPFPSPGDLLNPVIKPASPALQVDTLPTEAPWKPGSFLTLCLLVEEGGICFIVLNRMFEVPTTETDTKND